MPLGSVAEWRARIGSSWCALGRPFKIRSPFRRVHAVGRLQSKLTVNQVVTMIMVFVMCIGINLGLHILHTQGHSVKSSLESTLSRNLMLNLELVLGCFYTILDPLVYRALISVVNALPWIQDPSALEWLTVMLSNHQREGKISIKLNKSVLLFVYMAVTLLESARSIAASVISSQLIISGDVEQNPGPDIDYDSVNSEQILDESNLFEVMNELVPMETRYYEIGIGLRLSTYDLDSIESSVHHVSRRALTKVLTAWLQKRYNIQRFGPPTWQMLVAAVNSPAGGNNHTLAKTIALNHPAKVIVSPPVAQVPPVSMDTKRGDSTIILTPTDTGRVLALSWDYRAKWRLIGIELGIDSGTLDAIEANNRKVEDCLGEMIKIWLRKNQPKPTLNAITAALKSRRVTATAATRQSQSRGSQIWCCIGCVRAANNDIQSRYDHRETMDEGTMACTQEGYAKYLKSLYKLKTQRGSIEEDQWPPPVSERMKVCRLAMIMAKQVQRKNIENDFVRMTITGKVDDILQEKIPIELKDIFTKIEAGEQRKVLIEGAPGCGKSTLSLHICHQWAEGKLFQEYRLVILVRLRERNVKNATSIIDLLPRQKETMRQRILKELNTGGGKGVLFVLDGWDELPRDAPGQSIIIQILNNTNLDVIITSRPTSSMSLHELRVLNSRIEILGFTKRELRQYFASCLGNDTKSIEKLQQRIQENPVVAGSCYLPLNASILVHLFKFNDNELPRTQFDIFSALIRNCIFRHLRKRKQLEIAGIKSLDNLPPKLQSPFKKICAIAYDGIIHDRIIFDIDTDFNTLGLLQGVESFIDCGTSRSYNFLHLSIQELLAAIHMATELKPSQQIEQFRKLFGRARFSAVFQFYAAKTKMRTPGIESIVIEVIKKCLRNKKTTEFTSKPVDHDPTPDGSNIGHEPQPLLLSLLHCLFEAQDKSLCQLMLSQLNNKLDLSHISLSPADCFSVGYFLTHCRQFEVNLSSCYIGVDGCKILFSQNAFYDIWALSLDSNSISSEGAVAISRSMKTMINLQWLSLSNNSIGVQGSVALSESLKSMTYLYHLNLHRNNIKDEGVMAISRTMKTMLYLQTLVLRSNSIGDKGAVAISGAMKTMTKLQHLDLAENSITGNGAVAISEAMKTMTNLKELSFDFNSIGQVGYKALAAAAKLAGTKMEWERSVRTSRVTETGILTTEAIGVWH